eukprot:TRINITY_DN18196_c0_g1_i5.p1 TRINITY_DN18196_c0_g1~~TRINITY_DN18196_c0_g1_i5.p1  ORF type:complete len:628 (+),score=101.86 TRINITY_DN18196_c0_g1_i5:66-1949(+)
MGNSSACVLSIGRHAGSRSALKDVVAANDVSQSPSTLLVNLHGKATPRTPASVVEASSGCNRDAYYSGSNRSGEAGPVNCKGFSVRTQLTVDTEGVLIALVGLPARGKSFVSRKVESFFKWQGFQTRVFNVGKYRRAGRNGEESGRAEFFDSSNEAARAAREEAASLALDDAFSFLDRGGQVAIFDATNSTRERRQWLVQRTRTHPPVSSSESYRLIFVESVCNDPEVLQTNMWNKVLNSPDFPGMTQEEAFEDFKQRVAKYEAVYETMGKDEVELSYIKLLNMSSNVELNRIYGSMAKSLLPYLIGIHIGTRPIWLVRGSDAGIVRDSFVARLCAFTERRIVEHYGDLVPPSERHLKVLCSSATCAVETMLGVQVASTRDSCVSGMRFKQTSALNGMDFGDLRGDWCSDPNHARFPLEELRQRHARFSARWEADKGRVRFPAGESYLDIMSRVESCLLEAEMSTRPVMLISHIEPLQALLAYFKGLPIQDAWSLHVPQRTVIEVVPTLGGGFTTSILNLMEEKVPSEIDSVRKVAAFELSRSASCFSSVRFLKTAVLIKTASHMRSLEDEEPQDSESEDQESDSGDEKEADELEEDGSVEDSKTNTMDSPVVLEATAWARRRKSVS